MGVTGWWAEIHTSFGLTVVPSLGFSGGSSAPGAFGLSFTPQIGMASAGVSKAAFGITVTPELGMFASKSTFGLTVTPEVGMSAAEHYARAFGLAVAPEIGMTAAEHYAGAFGVALTPQVGMAGAVIERATFGVSTSPEIGMAATGTGAAEFGLTIAPSIGMAGVGNSPLQIIGTPVAIQATSITLPAHEVGDLIVLFAFRRADATNAIVKPAAAGTVPAWVDIDNNAGANACISRSTYFVATATDHTSGTWTSAEGMAAIVLRGQAVSPIGGHAESGGTGTAAVAPAITMVKTDGSSILLHFHGTRMNTTWAAAPAGYTRQAAFTTPFLGGVCLNTKDDTTSDGSVSQGAQTSSGYRGQTIEILS